MTLTRRKTLALIGGGTILAAGAVGGFAISRSPDAALAPWGQAGTHTDPRMRALSYAILAPNPHNRQPWMVDLSSPDIAVLHVETERLLPHTDPFNRQITIGLGCFLEILRIAALEDGLDATFDLFPEGSDADALDARPVAVIRFAPTTAPRDPLFAHVLNRRTLKQPHDTARPVPAEALAALRAAAMHFPVQTTDAADEVAAMRALSAAAFFTEFRTERTYRESVDLFRIGAREVNANPDGIDFTGPMFEALRLTGLFSREAAMDPEGFSYASAGMMVAGNMSTGMAYLWQVTPGNSREEQIRAGQDWVRINLVATGLGLDLQPLGQALQEFPEMRPHHERAHALMAPWGGAVQMWARLGYGPKGPVSPRWPPEAKILDA